MLVKIWWSHTHARTHTILCARIKFYFKRHENGNKLLPCRYEVAKVIFLHLSVILSTGPSPSGADPPELAPPSRSRHPLPQQTATAADGMHPTVMHSCFICIYLVHDFFSLRITNNFMTSSLHLKSMNDNIHKLTVYQTK